MNKPYHIRFHLWNYKRTEYTTCILNDDNTLSVATNHAIHFDTLVNAREYYNSYIKANTSGVKELVDLELVEAFVYNNKTKSPVRRLS